MKKHKDFDIWLHDDGELSGIHGADVASRETLRCWPLSLVERVTFGDGAIRIYKAYHNLPVESEFYRKARSRHIPALYYSHSEGDRHWLLLEYIEGRQPAGLGIARTIDLARQVREVINRLDSVDCVRHDLSQDHYENFVQATYNLLSDLNNKKQLVKTDVEAIERIRDAMTCPEVLRAVNGRNGLLHGDMKCDNIILRPDGDIVIIDWLNVMRGPPDIDLYSLLATQGIDPVPVAGIGPEILRMALEMRWFADCLNCWMPFPAFLDGRIAIIEEHMRRVVKHNGYAGAGVYYFH